MIVAGELDILENIEAYWTWYNEVILPTSLFFLFRMTERRSIRVKNQIIFSQ